MEVRKPSPATRASGLTARAETLSEVLDLLQGFDLDMLCLSIEAVGGAPRSEAQLQVFAGQVIRLREQTLRRITDLRDEAASAARVIELGLAN